MVNRAGWDRVKGLRDRRIDPIAIPAALLTKGANMLAIELRPAGLHPVVAAGQGSDWGRSYWMGADFTWAHARLLEAELRSADAKAPTALARPAGVSVWVEDPNRRLYGPDFGDESSARQAVRVVGAANGTYGGQVVVSTDRALKGLTAAASAMKSETGAEIPASAVKVFHFVPEHTWCWG